ncbi:acyl-CoA thioesterase domain-containing protein [Frankia sp. Cppng1_Ct_nod]|uniref:acyl-CoA thioesterase n=1 Tax=Frankia sp. Cppng1_Ct_nod TaxID=2897162 RepID=UPI0020255FB3|nr:acyl-CoA thioesterase domain-containing protein [Frankia sp. Cppng1_Ct_nod]
MIVTHPASTDSADVTLKVPLRSLLELDAAPQDVFHGRSRAGASAKPFGGLYAGQATAAAGRTVAGDRFLHSLHIVFLRAGAVGASTEYTVERLRDGRGFSSRRVVASQDGKPILHADASFHTGEDGYEHTPEPPAVPGPDDLPPARSWFTAAGGDLDAWYDVYIGSHPVDIRFVGEPPPLSARHGPLPGGLQAWIRSDDPLGADQAVQTGALTYASDLFLLASALVPHGQTFGNGNVIGASLDHGVWFHRPVEADEWLLYDNSSPWAGSGRSLTRASVFDRSGRLVASVAQEGLLRRTRLATPHQR